MAAQRKPNGADEIELLFILAAIAGAGYLIYKAIPSLGAAASKAVNAAGTAVADTVLPTGSLSTSYGYAIPGTPFTVADLYAQGWTNDQVNQLLAQATQQYGAPAVSVPQTTVQEARQLSTPSGWAASL